MSWPAAEATSTAHKSPWDVPSIAEYEAATRAADRADAAATQELSGQDRALAQEAGPLVWIGAHGGAGARSIATAVGVGIVGGQHDEGAGASGVLPRVLVVARSDARGLAAAAETVRTVPDGVHLVGLVISADAPGRPPREIRTRIHELSGAVPHLVTIPWVAQWRLTPGSPDPTVTKAVAQLGITSPHSKEQYR